MNMWDEKKIRIIDIADELGVSTATVPNVIHGKTKKISDATVRRVQEKLVERGYIPNIAATLLSQNNSRIVGVVVNNHPKYEGHVLEDPYISSAVNALSDALESHGYFFMLKKTSDIMDIVPFASMWNMDGMVIMGFCEDEYQKLRDRIRIPFVVYDGFFQNDRNICNLMLDDYDGGRQVGAFFRENGREKILFIADNRLKPDFDRYEGLCSGYGRKVDFLEVPMSKKERQAHYRNILPVFRNYDSVFAASDYYAVEIMYFLIHAGVRVPEDIWVVGFDDMELCRNVMPQLSSVRQDVFLRAEKAVEYLDRMKTDKSYSVTDRIPVQFVPRMSCGRRSY